MAQKAIRMTPVASYMPSVDTRSEDGIRVLDGENFIVDSKGPRSGFGSKQLTPHPMSEPIDAQSLELEGRHYVFSGDAILSWRDLVPFTWEVLVGFVDPLKEVQRHPWSGIYMNNKVYLNHPYRGLYGAEVIPGTLKLDLRRKFSSDTPGLIPAIRDMAVVRGRPVFVNNTNIQWGAAGDMEDFTPALAGAGGQEISAFTQGDGLKIHTFADGFVVWTTEGSIVGEYIGGDAVFRFYTGEHDERPIGPWSSLTLQSGLQVYLSTQGLRVAARKEQAQAWTQDFNEYLRLYIKDRNVNLGLWRLAYDPDRELVFVLESTDGRFFHRAFVLSPTLNSWGMFNEDCYGMVQYAAGVFGYVDLVGQAHYFTDSLNKEVAPVSTSFLNRIMPRVQKQQVIPSSTAVANAQDWITELAMPRDTYPLAGWYAPGVTLPATAAYAPLDAWVELGYLNMRDAVPTVDGELEVQELAISTIQAGPETTARDYTTQWDADLFFQPEEDYNEDGSYVASDITEDLLTSTEADIDWGAPSSQNNEDWLDLESRVYAFPLSTVEDWDGGFDSDVEDWDGISTELSPRPMSVLWKTTQDGITFVSYEPMLARFDVYKRTYALHSSGIFHRLRVAADTVDAFFHLSHVGVTVAYGGQQG